MSVSSKVVCRCEDSIDWFFILNVIIDFVNFRYFIHKFSLCP